jgi:hypothetical protein
MTQAAERGAIGEEFENAWFADARLSRRLVRIAETADKKPGASFPNLADSDAELEATYRFLNNKSVEPELVLEPHFRATARRSGEHERVVVIHDTTEFRFPGDVVRSGLGALAGPGNTHGFYGHFSLVVAEQDTREPLGVVGLSTWVRTGSRGKQAPKKQREDSQRESLRWERSTRLAESALRAHTKAVHVMDREADIYEMLHKLLHEQIDFVVRSSHDRIIVHDGKRSRLSDHLVSLNYCISRSVPISRRAGKKTSKGSKAQPSKIHPQRDAREAHLEIAASTVTIQRTVAAGPELDKTLTLNAVRIYEPAPPAGQPPVEWVLLTTLDISTREDIERIVDVYRTRWVIEEFFKALKTGCAFEKRQLESLHALLNALALLTPIAWRLLRARAMSRDEPTRPAREFFTAIQIRLLQTVPCKPLGPEPSVRDALLCVARLGGFLDRNGRPGWQTIGRGFEELLTLERGFAIAQDAARCDQS